MNKLTIFKLSILGFFSGFMQTGFGLGSGMLVGPNLISWANMDPAAASATAMYMACINSLTGTITVIILGKLKLIYALVCCIMSVFGTIPGVMLQHKLVEWSGRRSITVFLMTFFILFSIVANLIVGIRTLNI